mmetsp:Transcript_12412/g.24813  ORF Transcript_12412/g.24813 Transcript_12412/m.24813 type:complete len:394 (+) Transcript_12412:20-1201(+)
MLLSALSEDILLRSTNMFDPISLAWAIISLTSISIAAYALNLYINIQHIFKRRHQCIKLSVQELYIYPIKSCGEIRLSSSAKVTPIGFEHDRILQVVSKVDQKNSPSEPDWSFCTPREKRYEKLFHVKPTLMDGSNNNTNLKLSSKYVKEEFTLKLEEVLSRFGSMVTRPTFSTTMGGASPVLLEDCGIKIAKWLEEATGITGCRLVGIGKNFYRFVKVNDDQGDDIPMIHEGYSSYGCGVPRPSVSLADEAPFLLTTRSSLADLNKRLGKGKQVDMRRFRPNIVIDGLQPWEEDSLKRIRIGAVEFHIWQRCGRCTMTTIDRDSLERCGEPLSTLSNFRERDNGQRNFGMHLIPARPWELKEERIFVGDEVEILEYDEERRVEWMRLFGKSS